MVRYVRAIVMEKTMTGKWNRVFGYALAIAALCGFMTLGTSCNKEEPKEEPAAQQQDDAAKADSADKKEDTKKADKKEADPKDDTAKDGAADAAPADENAGAPKDGKYPLFEFTLKYTPDTARVGVLHGNKKTECKDGTCIIEATSETEPLQVNVHAEGYDNKSVTLTEKVDTYNIDLVKSAPTE